MKPSLALRSFLLASSLLATGSATAATIYWDGTSASWNDPANWSTASGATTPSPLAVPGALDDLIFNISTANSAQSITLDAIQAARSLTFNNTDTTTLLGGGSARTLTLGSGGLTMASGAGAVTLGDGTANNDVLISLASGVQTWTNNSSANFIFNNNAAATFSRASLGTLTFNKVGSGNFAVTSGVTNTNDIIGPWAFFGTGTSTRYATVSGGNIAAFTGTTENTAANWTSATTNYEFNFTTTQTLGATSGSANTLRYSGTGVTLNLSTTNVTRHLIVNGILAVGTNGTLTIARPSGTGSVRAGSSGEIVIAGPQNVTISAPITLGNITYSGSGTLTLSSTANTYTGTTTINSGTLVMATSNLIATSSKIAINGGAKIDFNTGSSANFVLADGQDVEGFGSGTATFNTGNNVNNSVLTTGNSLFSHTGTGTLAFQRLEIRGTGNEMTGGIIQSGVAGSRRGLVVGNTDAGTFTISGGTFTSIGGSVVDLIGVNAASGTLNISGGNYVNAGTLSIGLGITGHPGGTLNINSGSASIGTLIYNASSDTGQSIVNLNTGGTLTLGTLTSTAGATREFNFDGGQFVASGNVDFANTVTLNVKNGGAKIDTGANNVTVSGNLVNFAGTSTGGLTKTGTGTLTLSGTNTYTGATTVSAGTLLVNGSLGNSAVTVDGGAFGGSGTIGTTLNLLSGSFSVVDLFDALQVTGTVTLYAGFGVDNLVGLDWESVSAGTYTLINGALDTGVFASLDHNSFGTAYTDVGSGKSAYFQSGSLRLVVIPEPRAAFIGSLGLLALLRRRRG